MKSGRLFMWAGERKRPKILLFLAIILSAATSVSGIMLNSALRYWIFKSGINQLDQTVLSINTATIIFSLLTVIGCIFLFFRPTVAIGFFVSYPVSIFALFELFYGLTLRVDPKGYISTMYDIWEGAINTQKLVRIQKRFKCCGFHKYDQFRDDKCNISKNSCLRMISTRLSAPMTMSGHTMVVHAIIHVFTVVFIYLSPEKRNSSHDGEKENADEAKEENQRLLSAANAEHI